MQNVSTSSPLAKLVLQNNPNAPRQNQLLPILNNAENSISAPAPKYQSNSTSMINALKQGNTRTINPLFTFCAFGALLLSITSSSGKSKALKNLSNLGEQIETLLQNLQNKQMSSFDASEISKIQSELSALGREIQNSKISNSSKLEKLSANIDEIIQTSKTTSDKTNIDAIISKLLGVIDSNSRYAQGEMSNQAVFLSDKLTAIINQLQAETSKIAQTSENSATTKISLLEEVTQIVEEALKLISQNSNNAQAKLEESTNGAIEKINTAFIEQLKKLETKMQSLEQTADKIASTQTIFSQQTGQITNSSKLFSELIQKLKDIETRLQTSTEKLGEFSFDEAIQSIQDCSKMAISEISQNAQLKNSKELQNLIEQINTATNSAISAILNSSKSNDTLALSNELTKGLSQIKEILQNIQQTASKQEVLPHKIPQKIKRTVVDKKISQSSSSIPTLKETLDSISLNPPKPKITYQIPQATTASKKINATTQKTPKIEIPQGKSIETAAIKDDNAQQAKEILDSLNASLGQSEVLKGCRLEFKPYETNNLSSIYFVKNADTLESYAVDKATNEKFTGTIVDKLKNGKPITITYKDGVLQQSTIGDEKSDNFIKKVYEKIIPQKKTIKEILKVEISDSSPVVKILSSSTLNCPQGKSPSKAVSISLKDTSSKIKNEITKLIRKGDDIKLVDASAIPDQTRIVEIKGGKRLPERITKGIKTISTMSDSGYKCNSLDLNI